MEWTDLAQGVGQRGSIKLSVGTRGSEHFSLTVSYLRRLQH